MKAIADRLIWAVEVLDIAPRDRILEIGCGAGIAVAEVCKKLEGGCITAIDQSQAMIRLAEKRNSACIADGRAVFASCALAELETGREYFNKIFAVNVNLFWKQPAEELAIIRQLLAPDGVLYLFFQPPVSDKTERIADMATALLAAGGFAIRSVEFRDIAPARAVCITAE